MDKYSLLIFAFIAVSCSSTPRSTHTKVADELEHESTSTGLTEHYASLCEANDAEACMKAGLNSYHDQKSAVSFFKKSCDLGNPYGCESLGSKYYYQSKISEAAPLFKSSCDQGVRESCMYDAIVDFRNGHVESAENKWKKSCEEMNFGESCFFLAYTFEKKLDYSQALHYYERACNQSVLSSCLRAGIVMNLQGDEVKAHQIYETECAMGVPLACRLTKALSAGSVHSLKIGCKNAKADSCYRLGLLESVTATGRKKSARDFQKACDLGNGLGCWEIAYDHSLDLDIPNFEKLATIACDKNAGIACYSVATNDFAQGNFDRGADLMRRSCDLDSAWGCQFQESSKYFQKACEQNLVLGCYYWGWSEEKLGQFEMANKKFSRACDQGSRFACSRLAQKVPEKKEEYYRKACQLHDDYSCVWLIEGRHYSKNSHASKDQYQKLCADGNSQACTWLGEKLYGEASISEASPLLFKSCELENADGCRILAYLLAKNNFTESQKMFRKACYLGSSEGCRNLND
jgi:TPR repeat protein